MQGNEPRDRSRGAGRSRAADRRGLKTEGWAVPDTIDGAATFGALGAEPQAITLDLALGPGDGLHLARELCARRSVLPVIVSGRVDTFDCATGLEHEADDYMVKLFQVHEVALRLGRPLNLHAVRTPSATPVAFDGLVFAP